MSEMSKMSEMSEVNEMFGFRKKKLYYSNTIGSYIKNAKTGELYPWKVGSLDEQRLFKVKDTSFVDKSISEIYTSHTAYFNSPEEYMELNNVVLDDSIIEKWNERVSKFDKN